MPGVTTPSPSSSVWYQRYRSTSARRSNALLAVDVMARDPSLRYVAVSHIRSGGLRSKLQRPGSRWIRARTFLEKRLAASLRALAPPPADQLEGHRADQFAGGAGHPPWAREPVEVPAIEARKLGIPHGLTVTKSVDQPREHVRHRSEAGALSAQPVPEHAREDGHHRADGVSAPQMLGGDVGEVVGVGPIPAQVEVGAERRLHVLRDDLGSVDVAIAAVEEPQHELELVVPDEDLGVVAAQDVEHLTPHKPCASPERHQAHRAVLGEQVLRVDRAGDAEGNEVGILLLSHGDGPAQPVGQEVAVVVEDQDVVAARDGEPVVPGARAYVLV